MHPEIPIFYVTKDPERATGIEHMLGDYHIICPYANRLTQDLRSNGTHVFVLEENGGDQWEEYLKAGTYGMLKIPEVQSYISSAAKKAVPRILVLKTSPLIEEWCAAQGWELWAPKAEIAAAFENKLSQYELLKNFVPFPPTRILQLKKAQAGLKEEEFPLLMQFNKGHSGEGTVLLSQKRSLKEFSDRYPDREARFAQYIDGETYTLNCLAAKNGNVYTGSISLQITGLPEATANERTTVGNDFQQPKEHLTAEQVEHIAGIAHAVGLVMHKRGYVGLFGIDVIVEQETGRVYCIEVNTHQPASVSFEAKLHLAIQKTPLFLLWIRDMMEQEGTIPEEELLPPILLPFPAYQIIYRNKEDRPIMQDEITIPHIGNILPSRMKIINPNEELFRIQAYELPETDFDSASGREDH